MPADPGPPGFALYVHWPFCQAKCPYCDFNSHVRAQVDQARWRRALVAELQHWAARVPVQPLTSVFFGGGTPSLMPPETVGAVLDAAAHLFPIAPDCEVTLEANPTSADAGRFMGYRAAGVNRLSLGVQALDDVDLAFLGRKHSAAEALFALELARRTVPRVSIDLIYARPGQSVTAWESELARAVRLGVGHLSVYQLTIEPGTQFHTLHERGAIRLPEDGLAADLYETTQAILAGEGLPAYEISNHARPGDTSRHNLTYWRYGDYLGIGPGAHGRVTLEGRRHATRTHRAPEIWLERVEAAGTGAHQPDPIAPEEQALELLMMGLRLTEGIDRRRLTALAGPGGGLDAAALDRLVAEGLLEVSGTRLRATPAGRQRLNGVLALLVA